MRLPGREAGPKGNPVIDSASCRATIRARAVHSTAGLGRLMLERLQIHHTRQRRRPAARLIPLIVMPYDAVRLQHPGKGTGR